MFPLDKIYNMNIALGLKDARVNAGLRQNVAAKKIRISQTFLSQIETGVKSPSMETLQKCAKCYGVPIEVIFWFGANEKDVPEKKRPLFRQLKPIIDQMMKQLFDQNSADNKN